MHDLRKKILIESGKTASRKARSKPESDRGSVNHSANTSPGNSRPASRPTSRANSRPGSRYGSEDEGGYNESDDVMTISTASISDDSVDDSNQERAWPDRLQDRITDLQDRKHTSVQGRESTLAAYVHLLRYHVGKREVERSYSEILSALLKSIKSSPSAHERSLALKALTITILTHSSDFVYEYVESTVKRVCLDDEDDDVKIDAIYALAMAALYGGGSAPDWEDVTLFLLAIVESDGRSIGADDSGPVVVAALDAWALIASYLDNLVDQSQQALEAFVEQLDSTDVEVQASAGSDIAFLFEVARRHNEREDEDSDDDDSDGSRETYNLHYDPQKLISQMSELARQSSKSISKKDRRHLRSRFTSIVTSLELGKGPGYSTSGRPMANPHTGGRRLDTDSDIQEFGYRERLRVNDYVIVVDSWSLSARLYFLRAILGGGFAEHFEHNAATRDIMDQANVQSVSRGGNHRIEHVEPDGDDAEPRSELLSSPLSKSAKRHKKHTQDRTAKKLPKAERNSLGL